MRGRKPKPSAVKRLAGNPGHRPLNAAEPQPGEPDVRVPYGRLPKDGAALWRALAPQLVELGVLKATDLTALEVLCLHYAMVRKAWAQVEAEGLTTETGQGGVKAHPAAGVFRQNSTALRAYLDEFGLTPSSRVRIKAEPVDREKTLAELLFEGIDEPAEVEGTTGDG